MSLESLFPDNSSFYETKQQAIVVMEYTFGLPSIFLLLNERISDLGKGINDAFQQNDMLNVRHQIISLNKQLGIIIDNWWKEGLLIENVEDVDVLIELITNKCDSLICKIETEGNITDYAKAIGNNYIREHLLRILRSHNLLGRKSF